MKNIGGRLKEERERLGFSQAKFASACGVGKTAQFNYESNLRWPSGEYLYLAGELGVDVGYLLFSERTTSSTAYALGAANVLPFVAEKVGLNIDALLWILQRAAESESKNWGGDGLLIKQTDFLYLVDELCSSGDLLADVITAIAAAKHENNISLSLDKNYTVTMMLYRAFKANGNIDKVMVEDAVKLAAS
ncbi:helix-turn-helix domain-containing protein [Undibacterium sp. Ji49W]|uniref:helix-turn-helix domain-containing protein n=1 Tax=Undibacterium sp. Ji49W TaxID=3413040 RepID=UPI003BF2C2B5